MRTQRYMIRLILILGILVTIAPTTAGAFHDTWALRKAVTADGILAHLAVLLSNMVDNSGRAFRREFRLFSFRSGVLDHLLGTHPAR